MSRELKSTVIGMAVPVVGVLAGIVLLGGSNVRVLGFPVVFAWLFAWMPITSLCLHLAWRIDRVELDGEVDA